MNNFDMRKQPARDQYEGCGWAWVAIDDNDQIIAVRYMTRDDLNAEAFAKYRLECRRELSEIGNVVSGTMSVWHFIPKKKVTERINKL